MTEERETPSIQLDLIIVTLHDRELFKTRKEAQELAEAIGNNLKEYGQKEDGVIQAVIREPSTIMTLPSPRERRHGSTEFIIHVNEIQGSLKKKLEWTADLLDQGMKLHQERNPDPDSTQETLLRTVHIINTQEMPEGVPEEQTETPVILRFLTPSGNRCLSTATWERDHEFEQMCIEDGDGPEIRYSYRIESITNIPPAPGRQALLEIIMAPYTVGARFLLGDPIRDENDEDRKPE